AILEASMAKKRTNGVDPIVEAIRELGQSLGTRIDAGLAGLGQRIDQTNERLGQTNERIGQTNERLDQAIVRLDHVELGLVRTNERIDVLAQATANGFARMETRL